MVNVEQMIKHIATKFVTAITVDINSVEQAQRYFPACRELTVLSNYGLCLRPTVPKTRNSVSSSFTNKWSFIIQFFLVYDKFIHRFKHDLSSAVFSI